MTAPEQTRTNDVNREILSVYEATEDDLSETSFACMVVALTRIEHHVTALVAERDALADALAEHAIEEYTAGKTRSLRDYAEEKGFDLDRIDREGGTT